VNADGVAEHGPLPLAQGRQLQYCLQASNLTEGTTNWFIIFHDDVVASHHSKGFYSATQTNWSPDPQQKCEGFSKLSWFHHVFYHIKHAAEAAAKSAASAAVSAVKSLLDPCSDCKNGIGNIINLFTCGNVWAKAELDAKCIVEMDEEFPALLAWTPAICTAALAVGSALCKEFEKIIGEATVQDKLVTKLCSAVHLCD